MVQLLWQDIKPAEGDVHCGFYRIFPPFVEMHTHDFHEIFVIVSGVLRHRINQDEDVLESGSLVFVRADAVHGFVREQQRECYLVNTAFPDRLLKDLLGGLNLRRRIEALTHAQAPPGVKLNIDQAEHAADRLLQARETSAPHFQAHLRAVLSDWLSQILYPTSPAVPDQPQWFTELCAAMRRKENFLQGNERLRRLAGHSPEHVARTFRRYLGITPSQFINRARLAFARDLLLTTSLSVTEICYESGFESLSHFCRLFQNRYETSPSQYRKNHPPHSRVFHHTGTPPGN